MPFLRVMTFNMQLLPEIEVPVFGIQLMPTSGDEAEVRASLIADAIKALPPSELPDILVGNEVFNEDARSVLTTSLAPLYPQMIDRFDDEPLAALIGGMNPIAGEFYQDSGLFLASRWPIIPMPDGRSSRFVRYTDATGWDAFSRKGIGFVTVSTPIGLVTVACTHTQAASANDDENRGIRANQLAQIQAELTSLVGAPSPTAWRDVIVLGDLNIRGDQDPTVPGAASREWNSTFVSSGNAFSSTLDDGWRAYMCPPGALERDPGFTCNNLEGGDDGAMPSGQLMRLDYILTAKSGLRILVPQYMRTRFRHLSDHWSLEADLLQTSAACTPSTAVLLAAPLAPQLSGLWFVPLDIRFDGSYQWIYVDHAGTFTVFPPAEDVEVALFLETRISDEWMPYAVAPVDQLGLSELTNEVRHGAELLDPQGRQFELPGPFFIRVRARVRTGGFTGPLNLGIFEHRGETPGTAFRLRAYAPPLDPKLPEGQPLGAFDECWFRADLDRALSAKAHMSTFDITNATGKAATVDLLAVDFSVLDTASGLDTLLQTQLTAVGPTPVYLRLKRSDVSQTNFRAAWRSGLTYLKSDPNVRPMVLRCTDETGPDWMGSDEISFKARCDGVAPFFIDEYWGTADADEILKLEGKVPTTAFVDTLELWINEDDFIASQYSISSVPALAPTDPPIKELKHPMDIQSGHYTFEATLSRWPE